MYFSDTHIVVVVPGPRSWLRQSRTPCVLGKLATKQVQVATQFLPTVSLSIWYYDSVNLDNNGLASK